MRFRFTIRDLLWLTLVVATTVGWWVDRRSYSVPPRFQLSDVSSPSGVRTYLTDNQTGERWIKAGVLQGGRIPAMTQWIGGSGDTWDPTSVKKPSATAPDDK